MTTPEEKDAADAEAQENAWETNKLKAEMAMQETLDKLEQDIENVLTAQMELLKVRVSNGINKVTAALQEKPPAVQAAIVYLSELPEQLSR